MENYNQSYEQPAGFGKGIFGNLEVDQNSKNNLAEAGKWAKFLGIIGMIFLVLGLLAGIGMAFMAPQFFGDIPELQKFPYPGVAMSLIYLIPTLLFVYPTWTLLQFGSNVRSGIKNNNQVQFNKGLSYLKSSLKFTGILTLVIIALYIIGIAAMVAGIGVAGLSQ